MKKLGIRKLTSLLLAVSVASSLFLCACDGMGKTTETTEDTKPVITAPPNGRDTTPYPETKLDGNRDHHFLPADFCYIESEKYVLFLEKNLDIPGDFTNNLDLIIAEIEKQLGLSVAPAGFDDHELGDMSTYYGSNPWDNWRIGPKIAIYVYYDRNGASINEAVVENYDVVVSFDDLLTDEYWNSTKELRNEWTKKSNYIRYEELTSALTKAIVIRNARRDLPETALRGIGEYMSRSVLTTLAPGNLSIDVANQRRNMYLYQIPEAINADNAETLFANGYYISGKPAYVYSVESYGRYFYQYLHEKFGDKFFTMYLDKLNVSAPDTNAAETVKFAYGDDVFTNFGDWCIENHYLQYANNDN